MEFNLAQSQKNNAWKGIPIWLNPVKYPEYQKSLYTVFDDRLTPNYAVVAFRKTIALSEKTDKLTCWITADTKYRLYVNDAYLGFGPTITGGDYGNRSPMDYRYYDRYDLPCSNRSLEIKVEVALQPSVMAEYSQGSGALLADFEEYCCEKLVAIHGTDSSWECGVDFSYVQDGMYRQTPINYEPAVAAVKNWDLQPRELPNLHHKEIFPQSLRNPFYENRVTWSENHLSITPGEPVCFWLEFDKTYAAYLKVQAHGNEDASVVLNTQEILGRTDRHETVILGKEPISYRGFKLQSVHYINVVVSAIWEPVELTISLDATEYPIHQEGHFSCNDKLLNQIYELGKWTLRICQQDYHLDSPIHQETLGCTGDYMIQSLINYYIFGDPYLARKDILRTDEWLKRNNYIMFHTSYSLMWIQMLVDYYWHTGDDTLFSRCFAEVEGLLERFNTYIGDHGLVEWAPNYMFMDWVPVEKYNLHHPPKVIGIGYLTALYYQALQNGQWISDHLGLSEKKKVYEERAINLKSSFSILWNEEKQLYQDGLEIEPEVCNEWMPKGRGTYYSQHTNSLAVLYGLAEGSRAKQIMRAVMEDQSLTQAQPYFYHFIFEALEKAGLFEAYGNTAMRKWGDLLAECPTGLKEVWFGFDCDYSHSWGATPTYQMPSKILGIKVLEPGFKKIKIQPQLGDLDFAEGSIPTPYGMLRVTAKKEGAHVVYEVEKPSEIILISSSDQQHT